MPTNRVLVQENRRLREALEHERLLISHAQTFIRIIREPFAKSKYFSGFVQCCNAELTFLRETSVHGD